jgi:hypothetical protein
LTNWTARLRPSPTVVAFELAAIIAAVAIVNLVIAARGPMASWVAWDFGHYVDGARRWVDTGTPYLATEIAGPFQFSIQTFIHPPVALVLFAPFLFLPAICFWLIPLLGTFAVIVSWRPAAWAWPIMALQLHWPRFGGAVIFGNTDLWALFFIAAGLRFAWPIVLLIIKPSLAPLAIGELAGLVLRREMPPRRWRQLAVGVVILAAISLTFGSLWLDWLAVVRNSPGDPLYSIAAIPWLTIPFVAWIGRRRSGLRSADPGPVPQAEGAGASG